MFRLNERVQGGYGSKIDNLQVVLRMGLGQVPKGAVVLNTDGKDLFNRHLRAKSNGYGALGATTGPYAVRSSGLAEDGETTSYAGQHLTLLNVEEEDVWEAIKTCRASGSGADDYRKATGGGEAQPIHVLVQEMVKAKYAGVLFTGNPATGNIDEMVLEYVEGLGDKLVGGEVKPVGSYDVELVVHGSLYVAHINSTKGATWDDSFLPVLELGQRIDTRFIRPMDIEWAIDEGGTLWCLQARPLTGANWQFGDVGGRAVGSGVGIGNVQWMPSETAFVPGNVLFAKMTDPRMVREMVASVAIATEIGGRTCHAAIIARELHIPCVVGVERLGRIPNGTRVAVDANIGQVRCVNVS